MGPKVEQLATKFPELIAIWRLAFCPHKTKKSALYKQESSCLLTSKTKITKRLLVSKKFFLQNGDETSQKPGFLFVNKTTSRHSTCLLVMGLDTSLYSASSVQFSIVLSITWLLSYECFHEHNFMEKLCWLKKYFSTNNKKSQTCQMLACRTDVYPIKC